MSLTPHENSDQTLWEVVEKLHAIVEASPLAIVSLDPKGQVRMWNRSAQRIFGWTEDEVMGRPLPTVPPDRQAEFGSMVQSQMEGRGWLSGFETIRIRKDGTRIEVSVWSAPLRDAKGEISGNISVIADITDRRRAEAEKAHLVAREQAARAEANIEKRYRELLEAAPDAILEVDSRGRIVLVNVQAEKIFGYSRAELIEKPVEFLIPDRFLSSHPADRQKYFAHPVRRPMGTGLDLSAKRADGTEFAVDVILSPYDAEGESGGRVICVVRDISERKLAEEQIQTLNYHLEQRNREVERANRLKDEFLASMSHELRTPLNAIIGFSDLLAEQGDFTTKQKRFIGHIRQGAGHLLDVINDILDLSKIESGHLELKHEDFDVAEATTEVLAAIRPMATTKNLQVMNSLSDGLSLYADRLRFKQILYNLLSNAIKFTPSGGRVSIETSQIRGDTCFCVADTGVGIPLEEHEVIFDRFRQVGITTKGVREGTGLGLAITKRLVEHHGGTIWVESEPGKGSRFYFSVPLQAGRGETEGKVEASQAPLILVVEDEGAAQELLVNHLEEAGYRTATANSGVEAIRQARELLPDAMTLDVLMPAKGGWDTLREMKRTPATAAIPVIIISVVEERKKGLALGAAEYLVKPVSKELLLEAIGRWTKTPARRTVESPE